MISLKVEGWDLHVTPRGSRIFEIHRDFLFAMSIRRISNGVSLPSFTSLPIRSPLLKARYSPIMSTPLILNTHNSLVPTSMSAIDLPGRVTAVPNGQLLDVTPFLTPYLLR